MIEIRPSRGLKRLAKRFDGRVARKAMIKALNRAGKPLRKDAPRIIRETLVPTSETTLHPRASAASERKKRPLEYVVRVSGRIPVKRLRASARRFEKKGRGSKTGRLHLDFPGRDGDVTFRAARREAPGSFSLLEAGDLPERGVGPVRYGRRFQESRELKKRLAKAGRDAIAAFEVELERALRAMK